MRVLLASTRGAGHVTPLVPLARACRAAGDDVLVAAPHQAIDVVGPTGLPFAGFADPPEGEMGPIFGRARELMAAGKPDAGNELVVREVFGRIDTGATLPGLAATVEEWRPDVVVRDPYEFGAGLLAARAGIPHALVAIGLAPAARLALEWAAPALASHAEALGLADPLRALRAAPVLTAVPAGLEDGDAPHPTQRFRAADDAPRAPLPDWWPEHDGPLVYVSFGSVAPTMGFFPELYRGAIDALAPLGARVLVTVGRAADHAALEPLPPGVHVEPWVPQPDVMPHAAAMVGHGGFGSTLGAALAGVPTAFLPLFADQFANAERVAAAGAGVAVMGGPDAVAGLGDAVGRLLGEPAFRERAEALAAEARALPPVEAAVALLHELAVG